MASAKGYREIVEMLLKTGANPSVNKVVIFTCRLKCACTLLAGIYRQSFYTVFALLFFNLGLYFFFYFYIIHICRVVTHLSTWHRIEDIVR